MPMYAIPVVFEFFADDERDALRLLDGTLEHSQADVGHTGSPLAVERDGAPVDPDDMASVGYNLELAVKL